MRVEGSVISLSWIPSEAVRGGTRVAFDAGFTHYDDPPPDEIEDLEALRVADRFRFANLLSAWAEFDDSGQGVDYGYSGRGLMGSTTVALGGLRRQFEAVSLPDLQAPVETGEGWVRFTQTAGGRTGLPAPRRVRRRPFIQWQAPLCWSTLCLTLYPDRSPQFGVLGASRFPRHWIYDHEGKLAAKSGLTDFRDWYRKSFGKHTPWGERDSPALVTAVESALERALSVELMDRSSKPKFRTLRAGEQLVAEGEEGTDVFLVLDGVMRVEKGGERLAEYGPGAILGERSGLEGGKRLSTLVAVTPCRVAAVAHSAMDRDKLRELSKDHGAGDSPVIGPRPLAERGRLSAERRAEERPMTNTKRPMRDKRRPKLSREELRTLLVQTGRLLVIEEGLGVGVETLTFKKVFARVEAETGLSLSNASIIRRVWHNQADYQADVLATIAATDGLGEFDETIRALGPLVDNLDVSTPEARQRSLREVCRVGGAANIFRLLESPHWSTWISVWALAAAHNLEGDHLRHQQRIRDALHRATTGSPLCGKAPMWRWHSWSGCACGPR